MNLNVERVPFDLAVNPGIWMTGWNRDRVDGVLAPLSARGHILLAAFVDGALAAGYRGRWGLEAFSASELAPDHALVLVLAVWRNQFDSGTRLAAEASELLGAAYRRADIHHSPEA